MRRAHRAARALFKDQAACPFRAFARRRLASEPLETPRPGIDARERGILVHETMRAVWKSIETHDRLVALEGAELQKLLEACADEAIACVKRSRGDALDGRFGELERVRLVKLAREWLDLERRRGDFEVVATEEKRVMSFGGITVNEASSIAWTASTTGRAIIDYKTGRARPRTGWEAPWTSRSPRCTR